MAILRKPTKKVLSELEEIRLKHPRKVLTAESVVDQAKSQASSLHSYFEWDNSKAAEKFRIFQARNLINVCVTMLPSEQNETRVYVSLSSDRSVSKGGYRAMIDVLQNPDLRQKMLMDALNDLETFKLKYEKLKELTLVFSAIKKTGTKVRSRLRREKVLSH